MGKLTFEEVDRFLHELASLSRTGLPVAQGLKELAATMPEKRLRRVAADVAAAAERGMPLSSAIESSSAGVPREFLALLRCGEASGSMTEVLDFALAHSRRVRRHRAKLATTLFYPALVICVVLLIILIMSNSLIPNISGIFAQLGAELPAATRLVLFISNFFLGWKGLVIVLVAIAVIIVMGYYPFSRDRWQTVVSRLPGVRLLTSVGDTAVSCGYLSAMLSRGVPLPDALASAALTVESPQMQRSLALMSEAATKGGATAPYLPGMMPATAAYLYTQAEARGDLPTALEGIAHYCEERYERASQQSLGVIEPLAILLLGSIVGFLVVAMYLPLFSIPKIVGR